MIRFATLADRLMLYRVHARRCALALLVPLLVPLLLAACASTNQVGALSHVNFAPPPATDPTPMLSGEGSVGKDPAQKARTLAFLSMRPAAGRNHFMMAHGGILWEATGFSVQEAHAVVLDPGDLRVIVTRVAPEEWGSIALMMRPR
jgi:hypothetical protein